MDEKERAMELYKVEYEKAAERYENIYRSIWTIFSYLSAVVAGLLAFGKESLRPDALVWIAALPLVFWFWTTYLPLDRYGNQVISRLGEIEDILNSKFEVRLNHFRKSADKELSVLKGLRRALRPWKGWDIWEQVHRARFAIGFFFILLHLVLIGELFGVCHLGRRLFTDRPAASAAVVTTKNMTINGGRM